MELLLATRFPKPDVREAIRRLPTRAEVRAPDGGRKGNAAPWGDSSGPANCAQIVGETGETGETGEGQQARESESIKRAIPQQRLEPLSVDRFAVRFTAGAEFRELLEEVRALASHREPAGDLLSLMKHALEAYRRELQKKRFGVGSKPQRVRSPRAEGAESMKSIEAVDQAKHADGSEPTKGAKDKEPTPRAGLARRSRRVPAAVARRLPAGRRRVHVLRGGRATLRDTAILRARSHHPLGGRGRDNGGEFAAALSGSQSALGAQLLRRGARSGASRDSPEARARGPAPGIRHT